MRTSEKAEPQQYLAITLCTMNFYSLTYQVHTVLRSDEMTLLELERTMIASTVLVSAADNLSKYNNR